MDFEHGRHELYWRNNILMVKLIGSFNREGTLSYIHDAKAMIEEAKHESFYMLIDDTELEGGTPESFALVSEFNQWAFTQSLQAKALIICSAVVKQITLKNSPSLNHQNVKMFTNIDDGLTWLESTP